MVSGVNIGGVGVKNRRLRSAAFAVLMMTSALVTAVVAHPAYAQEATRNFDIPAQPLATALTAFGQQSGLQVSAQAPLVEGRSSSPVRGALSPMLALSQLLAGSGLTFRVVGSTVTLEPAPASADGAITLGPVRVEGEGEAGTGFSAITSDRDATERTGRYTGSQSTTSTRLPLTVKETPQSVTVVTRQRMDDFQMQSMQSVLLSVVGISENRDESDRGKLTARGFEITNMQIDGIASPFFGSTRWGTVSPTLDSYLYDRIEVVRGATGLLSADGDPSATINMVRKKPGKEFAASGFGTVGSREFYRGGADLSIPITADGGVRARLIGVYQQGDSFRVRSSDKRLLLSALVEADLTATTLLRVVNAYQDSKSRGSTFGGVPLYYSDGSRLEMPRSTNLSAAWSRWIKRENRTEFTLEQKINEQWKLVAAVGRTWSTSNPRVAFLGNGAPDKVGNGRDFGPLDAFGRADWQFHAEAPSTWWTYDAHLNGSFRLFGREHMLTLGANGYRRNDRRYIGGIEPLDTSSVNMNVFTFTGIMPEPARIGPRVRTRYHKYEMDGVFGSMRFSLADPIHVIVGGRLTDYRTSSEITNQGTLAITSTESKPGKVFTPFLGATFDIIPQLTVYASYADLFTPQTERDGNGNVIDPIVGSNKEVGLKAELFGERLTINAALYEAKRDNVAELVLPQVVLSDGSEAYRSSGKGNKTRGYEIEVNGAVTDRWNLYAGYAQNRTTTPAGMLTNTYLPQRTLKLQTTWRPPVLDDRLTIGGSLNWQSATWSEFTLAGVGTIRPGQGGYELVNLMARYAINDRIAVSINANNLFDKHYYTGIENGYGNYGEPRSILATVNLRY